MNKVCQKALSWIPVALSVWMSSCGHQDASAVFIQHGSDGNAPFVSQIESSRGNSLAFCTGVWIASRAMLTADHCVRDKDLIEYYPLSGPHEGEAMVGRGILLHPAPVDCMRKPLFERELCLERESLDVALVVFSHDLAPATAPLLKTGDAPPSRATIFGYGTTRCGTATERVLYSNRKVQTLDLPLAKPTGASHTMRFAIQSQDASEQVCQGDSGGPWMDKHAGALFAVTSSGAQFADGTRRLYGASWESVEAALQRALTEENLQAVFVKQP